MTDTQPATDPTPTLRRVECPLCDGSGVMVWTDIADGSEVEDECADCDGLGYWLEPISTATEEA